jgi:ParB family transcriptional regulator, chromosome partitioning protein
VATRKKATKKNGATATKAPRRKKKGVAEPASRGVDAVDLGSEDAPDSVKELEAQIREDGGSVLAAYREPLGAHWTVLAGIPIDRVKPTPFQRDLSETHVGRLQEVLAKLDRFLDPVITVRNESGEYWTPNGNHRLQAMTRLGAKAIVSLVVPDTEIAYKILALNTEKAHNLREKALEVVRMARSLAELDPRPEQDFAMEFEEPALLTLGLAYEKRGRFSGGVYHSALKRADVFLSDPLPEAMTTREELATKLLELDDAVVAQVTALKERGLTSPYLKAFVVARINPLRFLKGEAPPLDEVLDKMLRSAQKFDASKVSTAQLATAAGPPAEE